MGRARAWREANAERFRAVVRAYQISHRDILNKAKSGWSKRNPEKRKAQNVLGYAVLSGKLIKPDTCQKCGLKKRIEAHHPDYSKPLEVMWFCKKCHIEEHGWTPLTI
jgi:hypothetical protein